MKSFINRALIAMAVATFAVWTACGGGGGSPIAPPTGGSSSNLSFYLTDSPLDGAQAVWVGINSVSIHNSATDQWIPVISFSPAREFDVLSLQTVRQFLAATRVPAGTYDRVRLDIAGVRVVRNGESRAATLARNPVDIPVTFSVSESGSIEVTIDIEASLALVEDATGLHFDPGRVKVLPPNTTVTVPPGAGGGIVPPPGDGSDPSRRAVIVHGKVSRIFPDNLAFLMETDAGNGGIQPLMHPSPGGHQILVLTRNDTRYFPEGKGFGDLAVGMKVAIAGVPVRSGDRDAIVAFEVYLRQDDSPGNGTLRGVILEVLKDLRLVKVGKPWDHSFFGVSDGGGSVPGHPGQWRPPMEYTWVAVTDQTRITTPDGTALTIDDLRVGQFTEVTGRWRSSDIFEAVTMVVSDQGPPPPPSAVSLAGIIVDISPADFIFTLAVNGVPGPIDPGFPVGGPGGIGSGSPLPGHPPDDGVFPPIRLVRVKVTRSTIILGPDRTNLTFADLRVGMFVEVRGSFEGDLLVAQKILVRRGPPEVVPFAGIIREKDEQNKILILDYPVPLGAPAGMEPPPLRIKVTDDTDIRDSEGNPLTWADLAVGEFIHGEGKPLPEEQVILAHFIRVGAPPPPPSSVLVGRIVDIHSETRSFVLAVGGFEDGGSGGASPPGDGGGQPQGFDDPGGPPEFLVEVFTDDGTEFIDADGSAISFGDLAIGDFVECAGEWTPHDNASPRFLAHRVHRIHPPPPPPAIVEGRIVEIFADQRAFVIERPRPEDQAPERIHILTNENTQFFGPIGEPIRFEDLAVGDFVTVMGEWLPADPTHPPAMMAHEVHKHGSPPPPPQAPSFVFGMVSRLEIGPERGHFNLEAPCDPTHPSQPDDAGINVVFERGVVVVDRDENPVALEQLANGQLVLVFGEWSPLTIFPPIFVARKIVILDTDDTTSCVHGQVLEVDPGHRVIVLSNGPNSTERIRVSVPLNAWILLPNGERIRLEDIHTGDFLGILGDWVETPAGTRMLVADLVLKHPPPMPR